MSDQIDSLLGQMKHLEKELLRELTRQETKFLYTVKQKKVAFTAEARKQNRLLRKGLLRFLYDSQILTIVSGFFLWSMIIPIVLLDLMVSVYQFVCFPIYKLPKVIRGDYLLFDRRRLSYLNLIEKFNCEYCAYANGILAYAVEIAGRTEQYFCPIRHALRIKTAHSRYKNFFDYGDAETFRERFEKIRRDFKDLPESESP
jgi:hypothetical protein